MVRFHRGTLCQATGLASLKGREMSFAIGNLHLHLDSAEMTAHYNLLASVAGTDSDEKSDDNGNV